MDLVPNTHAGQAELLSLLPAGRSLLARWKRARELGADPDGVYELGEALVDPATIRAATEHTEPVLRHARRILEDFVDTCSRRDFVTLLADARGVVTHSFGGGAFRHEARRLRLIEGAAWSEALRGTNAIGTALAEGRPTAVHGAAHFARVNEGLVCFAAPIRDPHGEIVAVLDATSFAERAPALDASVVLTVARAIEEVLRVHTYARTAGGVELVDRLLERAPGAAFLFENPGRLVRVNARGRRFLERRGGETALPAWHDLVGLAEGSGEATWSAERGPDLRISVEPILQPRGDLLALLVFVSDAPGAVGPARRGSHPAFASILGDDAGIVAAREQCARLAQSDQPVLFLAESGSGKELFARALHEASPRACQPYLVLACGAIQPELCLSELCGHGPGAFSGADPRGREGLLAATDAGTLFLDEVAELSNEAQVALLRLLEDGSYTRVGETRSRRSDVRIVAATCRDLRALVASGAFRQDLFFRIGGACVELPALRQRSDLGYLVDALWERVELPDGTRPPRMSLSTRARLVTYSWPGNVRELESALQYATVMAAGAPTVEPEHLPAQVRGGRESPSQGNASHPGRGGGLDEARRASLLVALRASAGNVSEAARRLGVARSTVYRLARRYDITLG